MPAPFGCREILISRCRPPRSAMPSHRLPTTPGTSNSTGRPSNGNPMDRSGPHPTEHERGCDAQETVLRRPSRGSTKRRVFCLASFGYPLMEGRVSHHRKLDAEDSAPRWFPRTASRFRTNFPLIRPFNVTAIGHGATCVRIPTPLAARNLPDCDVLRKLGYGRFIYFDRDVLAV